jgi:hypothetical protein
MKTYQHTQSGNWIFLVLAAVGAVPVIVGALQFRLLLYPSLLLIPILLLVGWLFHSLTIEIADGELRWRYGPGWIRKRVPLGMITSAEPVRTNFIEGWGIHLSRFGWLYNVSGFDAVAIRMKNGQHFALGTDESQALLAAIRSASGAAPR